jgi:hypothetical protein
MYLNNHIEKYHKSYVILHVTTHLFYDCYVFLIFVTEVFFLIFTNQMPLLTVFSSYKDISVLQ